MSLHGSYSVFKTNPFALAPIPRDADSHRGIKTQRQSESPNTHTNEAQRYCKYTRQRQILNDIYFTSLLTGMAKVDDEAEQEFLL